MPAPPKVTIAETTTTPSPSSCSKDSKSVAPATQSQASGLASESDISGLSSSATPGPSQGSTNSTRLADLDDYMLAQITRLGGAPTPPMRHYEQMHHLWKLCCNDSDEIKSHPFVHEYRRLLREMLQRFNSILKSPPPSFRAQPRAELVNTMNSDDVSMMVVIMDQYVKMMGFDFDNIGDSVRLPNIDRKNTEVLAKAFNVLMEDVVILGFLSWLAKNRHDVLDVMFGGKFCIYVVKRSVRP
jgi:hypothetical protein